MIKRFGCLLLIQALIAAPSFASQAQEKMYLTQILNQLNAMQPLILSAQRAQPANTRIQFHYHRYRDNTGHWHNGLWEDVQAIKTGILEKLNHTSTEPRVFAPVKGDYVQP